MSRQRKTKREKLQTEERKKRTEGFVIKEEWLSSDAKKPLTLSVPDTENKKFFRADLTKTLILTMLVVAFELALWQYLSRH